MKLKASTRKPRRKVHKPHLSTVADARAVRSRQRIRAAFLDLLQARYLDQITIREICTKASLNYVTFFRHYLTKDSLLEDIAAEEVKQLVALTLPVFNAENTAAAAVTLCAHVDRRRKLWTTLLTGGAAATVRRTLMDLSMEVGRRREHASSWPPQEVAVAIFVASTVELLTWWLRQDRPVPVTDVAEIFEGFIVTPAITVSASRKRRATAKAQRRARPIHR